MTHRQLEEEETVARRRALRVIDNMTGTLLSLVHKLNAKMPVDGLDARNLAGQTAELTHYLTILETVANIRKLDEATQEQLRLWEGSPDTP